jgi:hypothetical protein
LSCWARHLDVVNSPAGREANARASYDVSESHEYLAAAGKTPEDAAVGRPGRLREEGGQVKLPEPPGRGEGPAG